MNDSADSLGATQSTKRPLTPVASPVPAKRQAIDICYQLSGVPSDDAICGSLSYSSNTATGTVIDTDDDWMAQYVDLNQHGDSFLALENDISTNRLDDKSVTISSSQPRTPTIVSGQTPVKDAIDTEQAYSLDDSDEEELVQLMEDTVENISKLAPPSEAQKISQHSRSASNYGSQPQHSMGQPSLGKDVVEPDLLDEDVDWDLVTACIQKAAMCLSSKSGVIAAANTPPHTALSSPSPFIRPPFPTKTRDRSPVVGMSSTLMMRTCFRIGEVLNVHGKCARDKQDVVLELFARVTYSNRESDGKTQHFQLRDLFTDRQPFLSGAFRNWKNGGPIDQQTKTFMGPGGKNKLCRCVCRIAEDNKTVTRRSAEILSIRETTWDEVEWALRIVSRDAASDEEHEPPASTA